MDRDTRGRRVREDLSTDSATENIPPRDPRKRVPGKGEKVG